MNRGPVPIQGYRRSVAALLPDDVDVDALPAARFDRLEFIGHWLPDMADARIDLGPLAALVDHVTTDPELSKVVNDEDRNRLDAWTAPRIHAALRIPRRLAARQEFWTWIALEHAAAFGRLRFRGDDGRVARWRLTGNLLRNAISRLWWGAEMARDGSDYRAVEHVFGRTRTAQFALELGYSHYRSACIAFARVAEGADDGPRLSDQEMNTLSTSVNARLSLRVLEAADEGTLPDAKDVAWWTALPSIAELTGDDLPVGPDDGYASKGSVVALETWFRSLSGGREDDDSGLPEGGAPSDWTTDVAPPVEAGDPDSDGRASSVSSLMESPFVVDAPESFERDAVDVGPPLADTDLEAPVGIDAIPSGQVVNENDRYVELPLPEPWRPILASYAPDRAMVLEPEACSVDRVMAAFRTEIDATRTRSILVRRLMGERTLEEVGSVYGVTRERVRQLQQAGLKKLHHALAASEPAADDIQRRLETIARVPLVLERTPENRLVVGLLHALRSEVPMRTSDIGERIVVHLRSFFGVVGRMEADVAGRREFVRSDALAQRVGIDVEAVSVGVAMSDKLYYDRSGRIGTTGWSKSVMLEVVAWILALSDLEVTTWHASELCEAAKVVFPDQFSDWRSRHTIATLSRPDVTAFVNAGRRGTWGLREAISGPATTTAAIRELLAARGGPVGFEEIMSYLQGLGRDVRRPTVAAILVREDHFEEAAENRWTWSAS